MKHWYKLLVPVMLLIGIHQGVAQQRSCYSAEYLQEQATADPGRLMRLQQIEQFTEQYIAEHPNADRAVVTIPVVVHVVYNTTAQNISDAQIQSQIDVLNADFRKLNADAGNTPSLFAGLVADCQIEFCMAQRDPSGNPTNGITRTYTTRTSFGTNDYVKYNSTGGHDAWDRNQYLNIWVCNLGGYLGYAQFPGGAAATDGVVCTYTGFGTTGTAQAPFNKGRTATHEIGHWLNLYHIWGDDGSGCTGSDNCSDTPNQADENYGCPNYPNPSCSNTSDMYMNYMDYTDDPCMYMFTTGQSQRISAVLAPGGFRYSLLSSTACTPPTPSACGTPSSLSTSNITLSSATLTWGAVSGATSYNVQYKASSASTWTTVNTASTSYALSGLASGTTYNWQVQALCDAGSGNYASSSFTTTSTAPTCTDNYESNNSRNTAKIMPVNTTITARIGTSSDVDWFRFNNTSSAPKIKISMTGLPADYDVKLYRNNTLVGTSENGGTTSEQIVYNTTTLATYYVKVYGWNGAYNATQCYNLTASLSASNFKDADGQLFQPELVEAGSIDVYPNPTNGKINVDYLSASNQDIQLYIVDMMGRVVMSQNASVYEGPNSLYVDMNDLSNGMYLVMVKDASGESTKRVMLQR